MGNESGEWIMHGMKWDNPECIHSVDEAIKYINEFGFLPLFKNDIDGFSLEERTVPEYWWSDNPEIDPWMWRAIIARRHDIVYGKFFDKKAGFISKKWLPVFANYRRDGYDFDALYDDGKAPNKHKKIRFKGYKYNHHMKIEFAADNKRLGQVLYALAHSSLRPEFSIEYTVADVEKCKNELLHKAIEDSIQKAQVLTTAANVKLGEIQAIDYSWGEIDFVTKPLNEMRLMECTECEMSAPGAYDIDIEADDINVTDTATVIWEIA